VVVVRPLDIARDNPDVALHVISELNVYLVPERELALKTSHLVVPLFILIASEVVYHQLLLWVVL
jgi:hypothetical protein